MKTLFISVILTVKAIAVKGMGGTSIRHMMERRVRTRTAALSTALPPPHPPTRKKESTVTAATANSSDMAG